MSKRILFAVNGFGMGNATRCDALADLMDSADQVDFVTSDKALLYFQSSRASGTIYPQKNINSGKAEEFGSPLFFLKIIPRFFHRLLANFITQRKLIALNKYDMVVFDSDYSFILHRLFRTKTTLLGLNNSYEVLNYFLTKPRSLRLSLLPSLVVEVLDFTMYAVFCKFVICPSIKPEALRGLFGKFLVTPLLVRERLVSTPLPSKKIGVLIMASSSQVDSPISRLGNLSFTTDNIQQLQETRAIVCNAGQSSISECLYLNKPALLVPIPRHAEQFVNARLASEKGMQQSDVITNIDFTFAREKNYNYDYAKTATTIKKCFAAIEESLA